MKRILSFILGKLENSFFFFNLYIILYYITTFDVRVYLIIFFF